MVNDYIKLGKIKVPKEFVTKVQVVTAKRDSGKSYLAGVEEEESVEAQWPFVVCSGMKAHNGLRSKYPIPVFGPVDYNSNQFQPDMDLKLEDARPLAHLIVEQNLTCILYLGNWSLDEQRSFAAELWDEFYYINQTPRHLFVEEADVFAPQKNATSEARESKRSLDTLVRRGREKGLGVSLITQRPQVLDKDLMTQADLYLLGNFIADQDLKAIENLLKHNGKFSGNELKTLIKKISEFEQGDFLFYSPSWLKMLEPIKVQKRKSYHAGETPEFGKKEKWKAIPVDVEHYRSRLEIIKNPIDVVEKPTKPKELSENLIKWAIGIGAAIGAVIIGVFGF